MCYHFCRAHTKVYKIRKIHRTTGWRKKKLTCLIKHNAETKEFITRKTCSSLSLMSNLKFDMPYMLFHAIFAEISKFQSQYAFLKSAQIS